MLLYAGHVWRDWLLDRPLGAVDGALGFLLLLALGFCAVDLRSQGFVRALVRGRADSREVALTFDDGPDPATTPGVLELLARYDARATFFVLCDKAEAHPELVRRILALGHELALHGETHRWQTFLLPWVGARSLVHGRERLARIAGQAPRYFRPPYGIAVPALAPAAQRARLLVAAWSLRTYDGRGRGDPRVLAARTLARLRPGDIVLLHDAPEREGGRLPLGPAMLEPLLVGMREKGLRSVTLQTLIEQ